MRLRFECLPEEVDAHVEALRRGFDVLEVSKPYPNHGASKLVRFYVEVRFTTGNPAQPANTPATKGTAPVETERLAAQLRRINNVLGWARARVTTLHAKRDKMPESQKARRKECDARADEVQRLVDELDKALGDERGQQ